MAPRLLLALGLMVSAVAATGCGMQQARQAAAARAAELQAREEAMRAALQAQQAKAEAAKEQKQAGLESERLKEENEALRRQLAEAQAKLAARERPADGPPQPPGSDQKRDNAAAPAKFTHVITAETPYYKAGPQQAQPPDGKFKVGTKVAILKEAGSYTLVRSEDGVEAYVAANALKPDPT